MERYIKLTMLVCCLINFLPQSLYATHMLQLNSYRSERYRKWCREHSDRLINIRTLLPALMLPLMYLPTLYCYAASSVVLLITAVLNIPHRAKKPLVFTTRVRRLLVTQYVLLLAVLTGLWFLSPLRCTGFTALVSLPVWLWVGLANYINTPLEKHISNGFIRDARHRLEGMPELTVIGITGSYGKTSTKTCLHALLSVRYNVLMTPESYNTTMGVVRTIRERLRPSHQIFIAEMGAKNPGDIREICDLVSPQYGIITSIGEQHLETFLTVDNIIRTKFELADALPTDGRLFVNGDNPYIQQKLASSSFACPVTTYGITAGDVTVSNIRVDLSGTSFTVSTDGEKQDFFTHLLGSHMIENLAGCIAVAFALGIPLSELVYPVRRLKPIEHRLQLLPNGFIDDAYNANPAGFRSALDVLKQFDAQRVLMTPGMVELGERQDALNRELGAYAADRCDIAVLVGEKQAPPLREGLLSAGFPPENLFVVKTLQEGLALLRQPSFQQNRIVLLENDLPDNF